MLNKPPSFRYFCYLGRERVTFAYPTLRKEREGWERIPREEQMLLPAVTAWGTRSIGVWDRTQSVPSEKWCLAAGQRQAEVLVGQPGSYPPSWGAIQKTDLN
jgi:hypothetical protein